MNALTIALLAVIAFSEVGRFYLTYRRPTQKQHFKQKLEGTTKMIWDLEFKVHKSRELREEIRQQYDSNKQRLANIEDRLKVMPVPKEGEQMPEEVKVEYGKLIDDKNILETKIKDGERQLQIIDVEIEGMAPTNENPDGVTGILYQIDSLKEVQGMIKEYLRTL